MIEVNVTLYPHGDRNNPKQIAKMEIINDGTGTDTKGNYVSNIYLLRKGIWTAVFVQGFPRKRRNVWYLVKWILNEALKERSTYES